MHELPTDYSTTLTLLRRLADVRDAARSQAATARDAAREADDRADAIQREIDATLRGRE